MFQKQTGSNYFIVGDNTEDQGTITFSGMGAESTSILTKSKYSEVPKCGLPHSNKASFQSHHLVTPASTVSPLALVFGNGLTLLSSMVLLERSPSSMANFSRWFQINLESQSIKAQLISSLLLSLTILLHKTMKVRLRRATLQFGSMEQSMFLIPICSNICSTSKSERTATSFALRIARLKRTTSILNIPQLQQEQSY